MPTPEPPPIRTVRCRSEDFLIVVLDCYLRGRAELAWQHVIGQPAAPDPPAAATSALPTRPPTTAAACFRPCPPQAGDLTGRKRKTSPQMAKSRNFAVTGPGSSASSACARKCWRSAGGISTCWTRGRRSGDAGDAGAVLRLAQQRGARRAQPGRRPSRGLAEPGRAARRDGPDRARPHHGPALCPGSITRRSTSGGSTASISRRV